jgi:hypothetical protein
VNWGKTIPLDKRELQEPTQRQLGKATYRKLPFGYLRVLLGFIREIEFMTTDQLKSHNCLFRATYLMKVIDQFVLELPRISSAAPERFRSRVLNPILQRQLAGLPDHEPKSIRDHVGRTHKDSAKFYLVNDALDPRFRMELLRNLLYIWSVRLALGFLNNPGQCTEDAFETVISNTEALVQGRLAVEDDEWDNEIISDYKITVFTAENLRSYYEDVISSAVRHPVYFIGLTLTAGQEKRKNKDAGNPADDPDDPEDPEDPDDPEDPEDPDDPEDPPMSSHDV